MKLPKKILVLGSGALKIAQAGEFDYSGSQALKAFKEEGIETVLINPNIATVQTSELFADQIYFLPVTDEYVEEVIAKEKPDAIALSFGGQTGLNCGLSLERKGILQKYGVTILGTSTKSIEIAEDRDLFAQHLRSIDIKTPQSTAAYSPEQALKIADEMGYPVMTRVAFALGGQSSGIIFSRDEMEQKMSEAFAFTPQVLVEQYLHHYKEIEYEVIRDIDGNVVTVCNMENMDPLGIHTGESIVVAPSQTLTNYEYHHLRKVAMDIVNSLDVVGECNVQFALNPHPPCEKDETQRVDYYTIEMNPRLSRSSALASKATGYPLAYVAAKLILGKSLAEIENQMTKVTKSFFEPALDYLVVKMPRWDLQKFQRVDERIGSGMKSVGEVMAIGRSFEETIQKAIRMLNMNYEGITDDPELFESKEMLNKYINTPTPRRVFALAAAFHHGYTVKQLYDITGIDPWYLYRIKDIVNNWNSFKTQDQLSPELLLSLKKSGFSDKQIGMKLNKKGLDIRKLRKQNNIKPAILQIDTVAGEFPAQANYLYSTYHATMNDIEPLGKNGVIVLGSGPYHIGSSVEFDWTCVETARSLKKYNKQSIIINCNPETVSTDYDISDRLYFDELTFERVADIYEFEQPEGTIVSVGGQRPNTLAYSLSNYGCTILGTQASNIDRAEDRNKFSALLDELDIPQPEWNSFTTKEEMEAFIKRVGFPVLVRPSYVLSGSAMTVCYTEEELEKFIKKATVVSSEYPVIVSKFFTNAKEVELDGVAQQGKIMVRAISEHIEEAGVHSGDATIAFPAQRIYIRTEKRILQIAEKLVDKLQLNGPFNIQFLAKGNEVYVIELNARSSRTFPFISKGTNINLASVLVDALFQNATKQEIDYRNFVLVKAPQFSFSRLQGADPVLRVEMSSTGEAACFGDNILEAFLKAELSVGAKVPSKGIFISVGGDVNKVRFLESMLRLNTLELPIYATEKTSEFLSKNGIKSQRLYKIHQQKSPNVLEMFQQKKVDLAINIADAYVVKDINDDYLIRRSAVDNNVYLITNANKAGLFIKALTYKKEGYPIRIKSWSEYMKME